jgi:diacylglycerol kinase (ATP)
MKINVAFIINPISGTNKKTDLPNLIQSIINPEKFKVEIAYTLHKGHATKLAQEYVKREFDQVIAIGGDGTVNEVAKALIHSETALGIIPTGSGNGLARHLEIPMNVRKAIEQLNFSESIWMDYGLVNNHPFFCTCGTGFDAYVSTEFAKGKNRGVMSYLEKVVTGYFSYKSEKYHLIGENIDIEGKAFVITFANASQWGNNAYIAPQASVQDGMIDISIMSNFPMIAIPSIALQLFTKRLDKDWFVSTVRAKEVTLMRNASGPFHYDGEPYKEGKEIKIKMVENGLKVLVRKRF